MTPAAADALLHALQVLTLSQPTYSFLAEHDPKALEQALRAVRQATGSCGAWGGAEVCDRPLGHLQLHGNSQTGRTWEAYVHRLCQFCNVLRPAGSTAATCGRKPCVEKAIERLEAACHW